MCVAAFESHPRHPKPFMPSADSCKTGRDVLHLLQEFTLPHHPPIELSKCRDDVVATGQVVRSLFVLAEGIASRCQFFQLVYPSDHLPVEGRKSDIGGFFFPLRIHGFDLSIHVRLLIRHIGADFITSGLQGLS